MSTLKNYLNNQLSGIENIILLDKVEIKKSHYKSIFWVTSFFILSSLPKLGTGFLPNVYLQNAVIEGIGPHFWNMIVTGGLILIGLFFLFPNVRHFPEWAYRILAGAYTSGMISLGLIIGELTFAFPDLLPFFETWKIILILSLLIFSILLVYGLVYSTFYISRLLISQELIELITKMDFRLRFIGFLLFSISPIIFLLIEK